MIISSAAALLGLAFFECVRIYRCFRLDKNLFPNIGFTLKVSKIVYCVVLVVFALTALFMANFFQILDPTKAFLLGFSVPSGAHLAGGGINKGDDIDDMESEKPLSEIPMRTRIKYWFQAYAE